MIRYSSTLSVLALLTVALAACGGAQTGDDSAATPEPAVGGRSSGGTIVVAVGDIACKADEERTDTTCQQQETADLTTRLNPETVLALGDLQYESGDLSDFQTSWADSWGRFDDIVVPVPGNHEYGTEDAAGFVDYFGADGHRVREIGAWRVYLVDSNCDEPSCPDEAVWLTKQLHDHPAACTAVAMHHPRWSSGAHGPQGDVQPIWEAMVDGGVDVALAGHDHDYERFDRLDVTGHAVSDQNGTRQFVVGTGGKSFYGLREPRSGSQYVQNEDFGVLELTLTDVGYQWRFVNVDNEVLDSGSDTCSPF